MRLRILACPFLALSMLGTLAACSSSSAGPSHSSSSSSSSSSSGSSSGSSAGFSSVTCSILPDTPASASGPVNDLAAVASGVAKPGPTVPGDPSRQVIVMEERHDSRAVQIEIAIMLERLYRDHGLRDLGLEGAVVENGDPAPGWFYNLPDACVRTEVALSLLREGEIGGAEFMAMAHPDFHLHAIEVEAQYAVNESPAEQQAIPAYLTAIGKQSGTAEQAQRYKHLNDLLAPADGSTTPVEVMPQVIDGLVALAQEFNLNMGDAAMAIQQDRAFWLTAAQRSTTMVDNSIAALSHAPSRLIVLDVGSAHTQGILGLLRTRAVSAAVLSPVSLSLNQQHGDLTQAEYNLKEAGHLIGPLGSLEALLEQRHRPPPPFANPAFTAATATMYAGNEATQALQAAAGGSGGGFPLSPTALGLGDFNPINIPYQGKIGGTPGQPPAVVMQIQVKANGLTFWAVFLPVSRRTAIFQGAVTVEQALKAEYHSLLTARATQTVAVRVGPEVMGVFSKDKKAAIAAAQAAMRA